MTTCVTGTSIEHGTWLSDLNLAWPQQLAKRMGIAIFDRALPGGNFQAPNADGKTIRSYIDAAIVEFAGTSGSKHMHIGGPFNDLMITDISQIGNLNWAVHNADAALQAAGWTVTASSILPFTAGAGLTEAEYPTLTARKQAYNSWAKDHFGSRYIDLSWYLRETRDYDRADYRFYVDGLHPNEFGAKLLSMAFPVEKIPCS